MHQLSLFIYMLVLVVMLITWCIPMTEFVGKIMLVVIVFLSLLPYMWMTCGVLVFMYQHGWSLCTNVEVVVQQA